MKDVFVHDRLRLVEQLQQVGIQNPAVLEAIASIPRHLFLDSGLGGVPYSNHPVPIGHGQTMSQPYIVAYMTELVLAGESVIDKVLELGTGSGYQAAILAKVCRRVFSIERITELQAKARRCLRQLGLNNIHFRCSDGARGWSQFAPYDAIVVTAAAPQVPPELVSQLAVGGRMVIPVGDEKDQKLMLLQRTPKQVTQQVMKAVKFVPLVS